MSVFEQDYAADPSLAGLPIGGLEYFAPSEDGDLYILAMPISKVHAVCVLSTTLFERFRTTL